MRLRRMVWAVMLLALVCGAIPAVGQGTERIVLLEWQPGGELIAVGGIWDVWIYDSDLQQVGHLPSELRLLSIAWSPGGSKLAILRLTENGWMAQIVVVDTLDVVLTFGDDTRDRYYPQILWSPLGDLLAVTHANVDLREASSGELIRQLPSASFEVDGISWRPDGTQVATTSGRTLEVWDVQTGALLNSLHIDEIYQFVEWSPDGTLLATTSSDFRNITIHDAATLETVRVLEGHQSPIRDLAWGQAGLASSALKTILVWEPETGEIVEEIQAEGDVLSLAWDTAGERLAFWPDDSPTLQIIQFPAATPTPTVPAVSEGATPADLRRVFNDPGCETPSCWLGIEPGITTQAEVRRILAEIGVEYTVNLASYPPVGFGEENGIYNFLPSEDWPYIYTEGHYLAWVHFVEGIAGLTEIPVEIPLQQVLDEYGTPAHVMDRGGVAFLVYPVERMAFGVSFADSDTVIGIAIGTERTVRNIFLYEDSMTHPLTDCSALGIPCPIPTATPTPTAPALSEEATPADLRRLLSAPGCQAACFLGIEPGMTATEMEAILDSLAAEYESADVGIGWQPVIVYRAYVTIPAEFLVNNTGVPVVISTDKDGRIDQLLVPLEVSVVSIVEAFGNPTFVGHNQSAYTIGYPALGLFFEFPSLEPARSFIVRITNLTLTQFIVDTPRLLPCTEPTDICRLVDSPTAAPTGN